MSSDPWPDDYKKEQRQKEAAQRVKLKRAQRRFVMEAKKYVRYIRKQVASGMYDADSPTDKPFLKAYDELVRAEKS